MGWLMRFEWAWNASAADGVRKRGSIMVDDLKQAFITSAIVTLLSTVIIGGMLYVTFS